MLENTRIHRTFFSIIAHKQCFVNAKIALYKFGNVCYNKPVGIPPRGK